MPKSSLGQITKTDFPKLHRRLQREKLFACVDANNTSETDRILREEGKSSKIHEELANYWIEKAESMNITEVKKSMPFPLWFKYNDLLHIYCYFRL
jgi:hypothetical protein